jgi:glycosyltransferase involved in cell wall biosynthesis
MTEKQKSILHAIDTTGPGGAETVFLDLVEKLRLDEYENYAVIKGSGWVENQLKRRGIKYFIVKPSGFLSIKYYIELRKLIRQNNTRLVHAHLLGSTLTYSILSIFLGVPVIATLHGRVDVNPNERFVTIKNRIMKFGVNKLIAVSKDLAGYIAERELFNKNDIKVIYNGIDELRYGKHDTKELRASLGISDEAILIGSLGNVRPAKSYDVLITAAAYLINEKKQNVHFIIAGHKKLELMNFLDKLIAQYGITDRVHFIGFHEDTIHFLGQLDFFALSSSSEGFSIATIEAMATGLPVVVTRCGGPQEILEHGVTGFLVETNNPHELANGLLHMIQHNAEAEKIATAGKIHVKNVFSFASMLEAYRHEYKKQLLQ